MYSLKTPECVIKDMGQLPYEEKINILRLLGGKKGMLRERYGPGLKINAVNGLTKWLGNNYSLVFCIAQEQATRFKANKVFFQPAHNYTVELTVTTHSKNEE